MNNPFQSGPLTFSGTTFGGAAGNDNVKKNKQAKKNRKKSNTSSTNPFGNNNLGGGFKLATQIATSKTRCLFKEVWGSGFHTEFFVRGRERVAHMCCCQGAR